MIIQGYGLTLDRKDMSYAEHLVTEKGNIRNAITSLMKDLNCTVIYQDGSRPRQTINYGYKRTLSLIEYLLELAYAKVNKETEAEQAFLRYKESIIASIKSIHENNLRFEETNPVRVYNEKRKVSTRSTKRTSKEKDAGRDGIDSIEELAGSKPSSKTKRTSKSKAKILDSNSIKFAGFKLNVNG